MASIWDTLQLLLACQVRTRMLATGQVAGPSRGGQFDYGVLWSMYAGKEYVGLSVGFSLRFFCKGSFSRCLVANRGEIDMLHSWKPSHYFVSWCCTWIASPWWQNDDANLMHSLWSSWRRKAGSRYYGKQCTMASFELLYPDTMWGKTIPDNPFCICTCMLYWRDDSLVEPWLLIQHFFTTDRTPSTLQEQESFKPD